MELTKEQQAALDAIVRFLDSDDAIFILRGYAGTGKTTLLGRLIEHLEATHGPRCHMLFAPTGRAAKVLREKTGYGLTIHKGIYCLCEEDFPGSADETVKLFFELNRKYALSRPIVIVDEASMISSKTLRDERLVFGSDNLIDDLMEFAGVRNGGQIIFIGDDAQLPPVGDSFSAALSESFFTKRDLRVQTATLSTVLRQGAGSLILKNAMQIRDALEKGLRDRGSVALEYAEGECVATSPGEAVAACANRPDDTMLVVGTNRAAYDYNVQIRNLRSPDCSAPVPGDKLLIARNNYRIAVPEGFALFNGEFCQLQKVGEEEQRMPFVGKERVTLRFRDATILHESGELLSLKILVNLLDSPLRDLTDLENKALYADFCQRHPELRGKANCKLFKKELRHDPYYNALLVKYGYAITCHKAQGGEWPNIAVDFAGQGGRDDVSLRWRYTAITRAEHRLMCVNAFMRTPLAKMEIRPVVEKGGEPDAEWLPAAADAEVLPETPLLPLETPAFRRKKFLEVCRALGDIAKIERVKPRPWRDSYFIKKGDREFRVDTTYNKAEAFKPFVAEPPSADSEVAALLAVLNAPSGPDITFSPSDYAPSSAPLEHLCDVVSVCAQAHELQLSNIVEHAGQYFVNYYFFVGHCHKIQFYFNEKGEITTANPVSFGAPPSPAFVAFLDALRECCRG